MRAWRIPAALLAVGLVATACSDNGGEGSGGGAYPRNETLYTTGTAWDPPSNWNPIMQGSYAVGTVGLAYEPLFLFDPQENDYVPWLAESDEWLSEDAYQINLREGVQWSDGEPLVAEDVKVTLELGQMDAVPYSNVWNYVESVEAADDQTVIVNFSDPRPQEWMNWVYANPIVPAHLWADKSEAEVTDSANEDPVGTGPYLYETHGDDRMVWVKHEDWWAQDALGLEMQPTYIVDIVNASNDVTMGMLTQHELDLSNNFLPGIDQTLNGDESITSFYDQPPYMLSANTAWLVPNHEREPLDDPEFRRALAHAIDMDQIIEGPYSNLVQAANPTGLLPVWDDYIDHEQVEELGYTYSQETAFELLEEAGYTDENGDGYIQTPDGDPIELTIIVPSGWTDWMESARVIAENAQEIGINLQADFPEFDLLRERRNSGDYDLVINNERQMSNTPWTYYDYLFQLPINEQQTTVNFHRYENPEAWELVEQFAAVPTDDLATAQELSSQIQEIQLTEMPAIPLWYNGLWSQVSNTNWTNWPSDDADTPDYLPTFWNGYWQLGSVRMLTEIQPVE